VQTNSADRRYWDEHIETMSLADLNRLEAPLIAEQIAYVYATSAYYRAKFDAAGVRPDRVTSVEALEAVPFTEKSDITSAQRDGALFGPHQCAPFEDIVRIVATGGTSGQPTRIGWTSGDADLYNEMGARALWANGCRQGDFVVNCFNYSLYAGGIMDHMAFETLGAGILPYGWVDPNACWIFCAAFLLTAFQGPIPCMQHPPMRSDCTISRRHEASISNLSTSAEAYFRASRDYRFLGIARRSKRRGVWLPWICTVPQK
jgi:phenylacetate-coenzyme A ligase PaaK-like adenylate-forming protein